MTTDERLKKLLGAVLEIDPASIGPETSADSVESWTSLRHMRLVIALEESFGITIPDEDVATMTSWPLLRIVVEEQLAGR
jgi:acyl carrier protein